MKTVETPQAAHRRQLRRSHAMRAGLMQGLFRHRRWIWATRLFRWSHGRLGRPPGPPRRAA